MNLIYPAIFHLEDNAYWVEFPDLEGCQSFGDTLNQTVLNAKEALEGYALTLLEQGLKLNPASDIKNITCDDNSFCTLVDCSLTNRFANTRAVKKTLTIPQWLNDMAVNEHINFSSVLQNALLTELHLSDN